MSDILLPAGIGLVAVGIGLQVYRGEQRTKGRYSHDKDNARVRDYWRNTLITERPNEDQNLSTYNNSMSYVQTTADGLKLPVADLNRVTGPSFHPGLTQDGTGRRVGVDLINRINRKIATQRPEEYARRRQASHSGRIDPTAN